MEITKREILFSTIIIAVMIGLGVLISNPIISDVTENALKISSAVQVKDSSKFDYIQRTDVGDFLAEGKLIAVNPVSIPDIQGEYGKIEKVKQRYTEHTRTVTETDSEGNTYTYTETYWEWDTIDRWEWEVENISFLDKNFKPKSIGYRFHTKYKETIKPKKTGFFEPDIRYMYYTAPAEDYGVIIGEVQNKTFKNLNFKSGDNINNIIERAQSDITSTPVIFWILWGLLTAGIVVGFYCAENKWLYDQRKNTNSRY